MACPLRPAGRVHPILQRKAVWQRWLRFGNAEIDAVCSLVRMHLRFIQYDPRTNKVMRVWVDSGGGRHYVSDDGPQAS